MIINGLITGSSYNKDVLTIEVRGSDKKTVPVIPGQTAALDFVSGRECIGFREIEGKGGSLKPCPQQKINLTRSQCEDCLKSAQILPCLRCTGEVCRNQARRDFCVQPENHALYLASFAPGVIKVGVSRWTRRKERLLEQGALDAIIIARDDGQMIRRHEALINKFGYPDRLGSKEKLQYLGRKSDLRKIKEELFETYEKIKPRMHAPWLSVPEEISLPDYPDLPGLEFASFWKPDRTKLHPLVGTIKAVAGQIIIVSDESGHILALDSKDLVGYRVIPAAKGSKTGGQMQLSLFD